MPTVKYREFEEILTWLCILSLVTSKEPSSDYEKRLQETETYKHIRALISCSPLFLSSFLEYGVCTYCWGSSSLTCFRCNRLESQRLSVPRCISAQSERKECWATSNLRRFSQSWEHLPVPVAIVSSPWMRMLPVRYQAKSETEGTLLSVASTSTEVLSSF